MNRSVDFEIEALTLKLDFICSTQMKRLISILCCWLFLMLSGVRQGGALETNGLTNPESASTISLLKIKSSRFFSIYVLLLRYFILNRFVSCFFSCGKTLLNKNHDRKRFSEFSRTVL